jgi:hypothetical protein
MVLKGAAFAALLCTALLAWSGAHADEYSPDEFFKLDLSRAALSPKPLGPPTQFRPVAVEDKTDSTAKQTLAFEAEAKPVHTVKVKLKPVRTARRNPAVRTRLARRHSNPLDAQAFDTRIQVWPCRSGGICNWRPRPN